MTDYGYAWRNGWRWAGWYLRHRRFLAGLRVLWSAYVRGYIGEKCQDCGRSYLLWHADDALYAAATGRSIRADGDLMGGLYCLDCFDRMAAALGIDLRWIPTRLERRP